jgi:hypothetical protein
MSHERYKEILFSKGTDYIDFETMRSKKHSVSWEVIHKVGLSAFDNKFYYIDATTSLPYGHYLIKVSNMITSYSMIPNTLCFTSIQAMINKVSILNSK